MTVAASSFFLHGFAEYVAVEQVGGRVDIKKEINEINFIASLTDSTIRGYESAPHLPDAIITADKRINSKQFRSCLPVSKL